MSGILEELVTVLGFEFDDKDAKKFDAAMVEIQKTMKTVAVAGAAAVAGLGAYVGIVSSATDANFKFAKSNDLAFGDLQRITHAGEIYGATADSIRSSIASVAKLASSAALGQGGAADFGFLGISPTDSNGRVKGAIDIMLELSDVISGLETAGEQNLFASRLGVTPDAVLLLKAGSKEILKTGRELDAFSFGVISDERAKGAEDYIDALVRTKAIVGSLGNEIALRLGPRMSSVVEQFVDWSRANKDLISSNLDGWFEELGKAMQPAAIFAGILAAAMLAALVWANLAAAAVVVTIGLIATAIDDFKKFKDGAEGTLSGRVEKSAAGDIWKGAKFALTGVAPEGEEDRFSRPDGFLDALRRFGKGASANLRSIAPARLDSKTYDRTAGAPAVTINQTNNIQSTEPEAVAREVKKATEESALKAQSNLRNVVSG